MKKKQETTSRLENILKNVGSKDEISTYMREHTENSYESFSEYFNDYVAENSLIVSEIVKKSNLSKNYVYNIINGTRNGSRDKIIAICIASGMTYNEINRGLKTAKAGILYPKDRRDAYIIIAVNSGVRDVSEINLLLEKENLKILE